MKRIGNIALVLALLIQLFLPAIAFANPDPSKVQVALLLSGTQDGHSVQMTEGETFSVDVNISNFVNSTLGVTEVYSPELIVDFDNTKLEFTGMTFNDSFIPKGILDQAPLDAAGIADANASGAVHFTRVNDDIPATANGVYATLTFKSLSVTDGHAAISIDPESLVFVTETTGYTQIDLADFQLSNFIAYGNPVVTAIDIDQGEQGANGRTADLPKSDTLQLTVSGLLDNGLGAAAADLAGVTWSSSDSNVASVDAATGLVTANSLGTAAITATLNGIISVINITVTPILESIAITGPDNVGVNGQQQYGVNATWTDGVFEVDPADVTWSSNSTGVATVSTTGVVSGVAVGSATITASHGGKTATKVINVAELAPAGLAQDSAQPGLYYYQSDVSEAFNNPFTVELTHEEGSTLIWAINGVMQTNNGPVTLSASDVANGRIEIDALVSKDGTEVSSEFVYEFVKVEEPAFYVDEVKAEYDTPFTVTLDAAQDGILWYQVEELADGELNPTVSDWFEASSGTEVDLAANSDGFRGTITVNALQILNGVNGDVESVTVSTTFNVDTYSYFRFDRTGDMLARLGALTPAQVNEMFALIEGRIANFEEWAPDTAEANALKEKLADPALGYATAQEALQGMVAALRSGMDGSVDGVKDGVLSNQEIQKYIDYAANGNTLKLFALMKNFNNSVPAALKDSLQGRVTADQFIDIVLDLADVDLGNMTLTDTLKEKIRTILINNGFTTEDFDVMRANGITWANLQALASYLTADEKEFIRSILEISGSAASRPPVATPEEGIYSSTITVELQNPNGSEQGTIYYTKDTNSNVADPTATAANLYSGPITLQKNTGSTEYFIKAIRVIAGKTSAVAAFHYTIKDITVDSVALSAKNADQSEKLPVNGVFYLRAGDVLTAAVTLNEDKAAGLTAQLGTKSFTESDFVKVAPKQYKLTYVVQAEDTAAASKFNAGFGTNLVASTESVVLDNAAPQVISVLSTANNNKEVGANVAVVVTVVTDTSAQSAVLDLSNGTKLTLTKVRSGLFSGTYTTKATDSGTITGSVTVTDMAGNANVQSNKIIFKVDSTDPVINSVTHEGDGLLKAGDVLTGVVSATESGLTVVVNIGSIVTNIATTPVTGDTAKYAYTWTVPEGVNAQDVTISAIAKDKVGNTASVNDAATITIDTLAPSVSFSVAPAGPDGLRGYYVTQPIVHLNSNEAGTIHYQVNGGDVQDVAVTADQDVQVTLADGTSSVTYWSEDASGNTSVEFTSREFKVDTVAPQIALSPIADNDVVAATGKATLRGTVNEDGLKVDVYRVRSTGELLKVSQGNLVSANGAFSLEVDLKQGANKYKAVTTDAAGHKSESAVIEKIFDNKGPVFTITVEGNNVTIESNEDVELTDLSADLLAKMTEVDATETVIYDGMLTLTPSQANPKREWTTSFQGEANKIDLVVTGHDSSGNQNAAIYSSTTVIASAGANIEGEETAILIPRGALGDGDSATTIEMNSNSGTANNLTGNYEEVEIAHTVDFRPDGTQFANPVEITIPYDSTLTDTSKIVILYFNKNGEVEDFTDRIVRFNTTKHTVTFETDHFSTYGSGSDTTPPALTVTGPVDGLLTNGNTVNIVGTTEVNTQGNGITVSVSVNGKTPVTKTTKDGTFNIQITLDANQVNNIVVTAKDPANNATSSSLTVEQDSAAPSIAMTSAVSATNNSSVTVNGTVTEANLASLVINGIAVPVAANGSFTTTVALQGADGEKAITATATDLLGQTGTRTIEVTKDTTSILNVATPSDGTVTRQTSVNVTGTADAGATVKVTNSTTGDMETGTAAANGTFSISVSLDSNADNPVQNDLAIISTDTLGNVSSAEYRSVTVDLRVPLITVTQPTGAPVTNDDTITIQGTVTPADSIVSYGLEGNPEVGGLVTVNANGTFTISNVALEDGVNNIVITAINSSNGLSAVQTVEVTKDTTAPVITITGDVNDGSTVATQTVTIEGTLNEPGTVTATVAGSSDTDVVAVENGSFSLTVTPAANRQSTITITATDAAGNTTTTTISITSTYNPGGGGVYIPPVVTPPAATEATGKIEGNKDGTIALANVAKVFVPAGTMEDGVEVKVAVIAEKDVPAADNSNIELVGQAVEFTTTGVTKFDQDVTVTISLPANAATKGKLAVYYYNETTKKWVYIGGKVDAKTNTISVQVNHFTKFAVFNVKNYVSFSDVAANHWAAADLDRMVGLGIISGRGQGIFDPNTSVTRAEFAKMLALALNLPAASDDELASLADANDIPTWAKGQVAAAIKAGIITGRKQGDSTVFAPGAKITRAEMAVMIARAIEKKSGTLEFADTADIPTWAAEEVETVAASGIINGMPGNKFEPKGVTTRAQSAAVIARLLHFLGM